MAARAAWRGFGHAEPNPLVGCVLVRHNNDQPNDLGKVIGIGHHRGFGGLHAERDALLSCRRLGEPGAAKGATAYVTLEPCNGHGKQPPCVEALLEAGVSRVVYSEKDPSKVKGGGEGALRQRGVLIEQRRESAAASRTSAPWRKQMATGLPWVIVKWAQTIDGKVAARNGDSKWISDPHSRRWVHTLRARVDAVLTGVGTVLADDPILNARDYGGGIRRQAKRIVLDTGLRTPSSSKIVRAAREDGEVVVVGNTDLLGERASARRELEQAGVRVLPIGGHSELTAAVSSAHSGIARLNLRETLRRIAAPHNPHDQSDGENLQADWGLGAQTVFVEAGPRLVGQLIAEDLVDEIVGFTGPVMLGDPLGMGILGSIGAASEDRLVETIAEARTDRVWALRFTRRVTGGNDTMTVWERVRG